MRRFRSKPVRVEAFQITYDMLSGRQEMPLDLEAYGIPSSLLDAGDWMYHVIDKDHDDGAWTHLRNKEFNDRFDEDKAAKVFKLIKG